MTKLRGCATAISIAMLLAVAPIGARAGYCDSNIVIFSENSAVGQTANSNALKCDADNGDDVDMRIINPGSDAIFVRYIVDLGASVPSIPGTLEGLGFSQEITLQRVPFNLVPPEVPAPSPVDLGFTYQTDMLTIPGGASASGCITATVYDPADVDRLEPLDTVTFHTLDKTSVPSGC